MYREMYQKIIEYYSLEEFQPEYNQARSIFEKKIGIVHMDHPFYESWIESFIEFFTFDHFLPSYGITPLSLYSKMHADVFGEDEKEAVDVLLSQKLDIVEVNWIKDHVLGCVDIYSDKGYNLIDPDHHHNKYVKKGDWMIVRVIEDQGKTVAFGSNWHFAFEIKDILQKNKANYVSKFEFIHDCMRKKVFSESYKHIDLRKVYRGEIDMQRFSPKESSHAKAF